MLVLYCYLAAFIIIFASIIFGFISLARYSDTGKSGMFWISIICLGIVLIAWIVGSPFLIVH